MYWRASRRSSSCTNGTSCSNARGSPRVQASSSSVGSGEGFAPAPLMRSISKPAPVIAMRQMELPSGCGRHEALQLCGPVLHHDDLRRSLLCGLFHHEEALSVDGHVVAPGGPAGRFRHVRSLDDLYRAARAPRATSSVDTDGHDRSAG